MTPEWIREQLKKPGKSQRGLAAAMNLDASRVNRILSGERRLFADEIEIIQRYLDAKPEHRSPNKDMASNVKTGQSVSLGGQEDLLKVLGMAEGGPGDWVYFNGEVVEYIQRPENLKGVPGAYAVYVTGHSMEPRYEAGERAHIHPGKPVLPGAYVLVQRRNPDDETRPLAVIKRLVRRSGSKVTLEQLNPKKQFDVPAGEIISIHKVVGASEA